MSQIAQCQKLGGNQIYMAKWTLIKHKHSPKSTDPVHLYSLYSLQQNVNTVIFLKKQGIHSLYAKLWVLRPLIKNIPHSSHWYGSNVTFGASLAFQMREKYVFEKKYFCENWTSRGVNRGVTQFHTQFTHGSRQCWALNRKQ